MPYVKPPWMAASRPRRPHDPINDRRPRTGPQAPAVWNNDGDTAFLLNNSGNIIDSEGN
jgi:hypothetical protein